MLPIDLDNLKPEDIEHIFETHRESNTIEYKRELQIYSERETKEFLADVSSFANANGGTIFYGIDDCLLYLLLCPFGYVSVIIKMFFKVFITLRWIVEVVFPIVFNQ